MLVLVARRLMLTHEVDRPIFKTSAMIGRLVGIAIWSRKEVKWVTLKERTKRTLVRGRIFGCQL